ncbi:hypothetical protein [Allosphingosinicella humi]
MMIYGEELVRSFRLEIRMNRNDPPTELMIEALDRDAAVSEAAKIIAAALGRPDEFVHLEEANGRFTVGAGLWSRNGFYRLELADPSPPQPVRR